MKIKSKISISWLVFKKNATEVVRSIQNCNRKYRTTIFTLSFTTTPSSKYPALKFTSISTIYTNPKRKSPSRSPTWKLTSKGIKNTYTRIVISTSTLQIMNSRESGWKTGKISGMRENIFARRTIYYFWDFSWSFIENDKSFISFKLLSDKFWNFLLIRCYRMCAITDFITPMLKRLIKALLFFFFH